MNKADKLAVRLKGQAALLRHAVRVRLGYSEYEAVRFNPEPCDPPDYVQGDNVNAPDRFCGLPVERSGKTTEFAVIIDIP